MSSEAPDFREVALAVEKDSSDILSQNKAYDVISASGAIEHPEFIELGKTVLEAEQRHSVNHLFSATADIDWEELYGKEKRLRDRVTILKDALSTSLSSGHPEVDSIDRDADFVVQHVPTSSEKVSDLADSLKERLAAELRLRAEEEIVTLSQEHSLLEQDILLAGTAWAIPRLVRPEFITEEETIELVSPEPEELIEVDAFPSEDEHIKRETAEKVRREYRGKLVDASERMAVILADVPKTVYTRGQMVEALYDETPDMNNKGKISALVSNLELDKVTIISEVLESRGLVFQKGRRTAHRIDGSQVGSDHPIYRAIAPEDPDFQMNIIRRSAKGGELHDGQWVTIRFPRRSRHLARESGKIEVPPELSGFAEDAREIIGQIQHKGFLAQDGEIDPSFIKLFIQRRARAARHGLCNAGLLPKAKVKPNSPLSAAELTLLKLYDSHRAILHRGSKFLEQASRIVNGLIEEYT